MARNRVLFQLAFGILAIGHFQATSSGQDLVGTVLDADRQSITNAKVTVWVARPVSGVGIVCPSCYVDCGRLSATNDSGEFRIPDVDNGLTYRLLAAARGYRSHITDYVRPDHPEVVTLKPVPANLPSDQRMTGRIVDLAGRPIAFAEIESDGVVFASTPDRSQNFPDGWDALALSGEDGKFLVVLDRPATKMTLHVRARGHAPRYLPRIALDGEDIEIVLKRGSSVTGQIVDRLLDAGNRVVGLVPVERTLDSRTGWSSFDQTTVTDANGHFRFDNLPADRSFYVYTVMDGLKEGSIGLQRFTSAADDGIVDLGKIELQFTASIRGQIILPDGAELPEGSRVAVSRQEAWGIKDATVQADGRFVFRGVPLESLNITVNVPGYCLDIDRNNYQMTTPTSIGIPLKGDVDDLQIFLIPRGS